MSDLRRGGGRSGRRARRDAEDANASPVAPAGLSGGAYRPLSDRDVTLIVDAAKTVLERTGVEIHASPAREVFAKAGARIDADTNRVYIPHTLVEAARPTVADTVLLAGRDEAFDLNLGGRRVYMGTGGQAVKVMDLAGHVRESTLADNYHIGRLVDTLEHIHFYMRPVVSRDVATEEIDINQFYACLAATNKHVMANAYLPEKVKDIRALAETIVGGPETLAARPIVSFTACWTVSPLRWATETVDILDAILAENLPVVISSAPQSGATSPASLAGTLVQIWAEQLSGLVYTNLVRPGAPIIAGCVPAQVDLRSGSFTGGSAEFALLNAACAQIAQHLKVPLYNSSGISDSKVPDAQAGAEKAITGLAAALAGANYIHHSAGFLESLLTVAYEQYVIDNDINGEVMRTLKGIEVTEESLALDVIDQVCRGEGHFLGHPQTLALMNTEYLYPSVMNRDSRADWEEKGGRDIRETARAEAARVLSEHFPTVIDPGVDTEIRQRFPIRLPTEAMRPAAR